jgi:Carboxypeptidase regulatory-like domain
MSRRFSKGLVLFLSCGFVFTASPAWAQNTGVLLGDVTDPSGAAVVKATVSATDNATKTTRTARTDSAGSYSFAQLAPGVYTVKVTMQSFKTYVADQVNVAVATPTTLNVRLELGSQSDQVTVTVPVTPSLNTTDATIGNAFSEKEVKDLPFLARNVVNLLTIQPGVVSTGQSDTDLLQMGASSNDVLDRREGSVNGMRGTQGNVTVDGADANDYQNEVAFTSAIQLTLDSVQEFRVTTASDNASGGGAAGARVALVTKSGSNEFHGNTRWYYRTAGATANSFFNNATGQPRPQLQRNIGGGSLGGRVVPDRLFFFVDVEARRDNSQKPAGPRIIPSDALRDGVLVYQCVNASQCPGGTVQGLTGSHTIPAGAFGLTPAQFKQLDPAGIGVNPAEIQYMAIDPHGNDPTVSPDNGLSFNGLVFNAPLKTASNIYTARIDYNLTKDGRHTLMWRGSLAGIKADLLEGNFPGQPVASQLLNNSRGIAAQYNAQFRPNLTNTFGWGFTRLGVNQSGSSALQYQVSLFDDITSYFRGLGRTVPVNEFRDDVTWGKGAHTWQFGGVVRFVRNTRYDDSHVYPGWFNTAGRFCARGCRDFVNALAPSGFPQAADPSSATWAVVALTGSIANATAAFYVDPKTGNLIPPGIPKTELRHMDENDIEWYAQDTWRVRPTLSLVAGLRYSYESPVWEQNGIQVCPTEGLVQWFQSRVSNMNMGIPSDASPLLSWDLCGPANHKASWWNPNRNNFGPRLSLAWSPGFQSSPLGLLFGAGGKSSLRLGSGIYYDRVGQPLAAGTDLIGSPGLGAGGNATPGTYSLATAPRFSGSCTSAGCTGVPPLDLYFPIATHVSYPFTPTKGGQTMGIDQNLRTPYAIDLTLSFERQLPKGMVVSVGYVGTLGRKLLTKADFSQWLDLRDPKSGTTLYHALDQVVAFGGRSNPYIPVIDPKNAAALKAIPDIPYFNNVYPNMAAFDAASFCTPSQPGSVACRAMYQSLTPTQAMYSYLMQSGAPSWGTTMLQLDTSEAALGVTPYNSTLDPQGDGYVLFTKQNFQTLPTWVNWGNSHYHSLQVSVRKNAGPAIFSANYVFSKSIDNTSVAENTAEPTGTYFGGSLHGALPNSFDPGAGRAVSDFDLRHNFNASLVVNLPFGRGGKIGVHANRALNAVIGGWELSGLVRWRSGFPMSPTNGSSAPLNIYDQALATLTQSESTSLTKNGVNGVPNLFTNPSAVFAQLQFTDPGQAGSRNVFRGPAYADLDLGVYKTFRMPWKDSHQLQFRASAFNTLNSVNFASAGDVRDTGGFILDLDSPSTFGQITNTAGPRGGAREMEFGVRYQF